MIIHFRLHFFSATRLRLDEITRLSVGAVGCPHHVCTWQPFADSFTLYSRLGLSKVNSLFLDDHSAGALHHSFPQSRGWQVYFIPDWPLIDCFWIREHSFRSTLWFILDKFEAWRVSCDPRDFTPWVVGMASRFHYIVRVKCFLLACWPGILQGWDQFPLLMTLVFNYGRASAPHS
jgi:hypothetical protein